MSNSLLPEDFAWHQSAALDGDTYSQVLLHLLERVERLEKKYETNRLATFRLATLKWGKDVDKLMRWSDDHLKRIMALEARPIPGSVELAAPFPEAAPVATDEELADCIADAAKAAILNRRNYDKALTPADVLKAQIRAIYDLGRQHGAAQPAPQPAQPAPMQRLIDAPMDARGYADLREPPPAGRACRGVGGRGAARAASWR